MGIGYNNTGGNGSNNTGSNIISGGGGGAAPAKDETCLAIERMEAERESRRQAMRDVSIVDF